MGVSRRNACIIYATVLILTLAAIVAGGAIVNVGLCVLLTFCFSLTMIYYFIYKSCRKQISSSQVSQQMATEIQLDAQSPTSQEPVSQSPTSLTLPIPEPVASTSVDISDDDEDKNHKIESTVIRIHYLDNLKSVLTVFVVLQHIKIWYYSVGDYYNPFIVFRLTAGTIGQSFAMCLFFFISAYFTPISCENKGIHKFMGDKFKRIGIPLIICLLILYPLLSLYAKAVLIGDNAWSYFPDPGVTWFLAWILIFNVCYILIDKNIAPLEIEYPSLCKLICYGLLLGIIQGMIAASGITNYIFMPITFGSLPFNIAFFICGVIARYNKWLENELFTKHKNVIINRVLTVIYSLIVLSFMIYIYVTDFGHDIIPSKNDQETNCEESEEVIWLWYEYIMMGALYIFMGICCPTFALFTLQIHQKYLNFENKFTKFLSQSAYIVFLIHPFIIINVTWSYVKLLEIFGGPSIVFCDGKNSSKTQFGHDGLIWLGWIYTVCITLIIVWPLAFYIKKIPGLNKIL